MAPADSPSERIAAVMAQADPELLAEIRGRVWTGHNIPLTATESTLGGEIPLVGDDPRTLTVKALIRRYVGQQPAVRVLDLGALEGGLTFELAREGWDATGIEGRRSNYEKAEMIRSWFGLENLRFENRDVKTLDAGRDGTFDAVICCGLLYHLDDPFTFLEQLVALTGPHGILFIDTCVAPDAEAARYGTWSGQLSATEPVEHAGHTYEGCWFEEPVAGTVLDQQWSAVSNPRSFWPTRRSLIRAVHHAGMHAISELFGAFEIDRELALRDQFSRLWLLCRRSW